MTSFGPFEFSNKTYVKLPRRKKVLGHSRFSFTRFKCAPFHLYSLFASTWHENDDRSKKYNFSQNLHGNTAAVTSAVIGDALVSYWPFFPLSPVTVPVDPEVAYIASVSVWFRSKESSRNGIFGFGRTRNGTRAKKWNWGRRGMVRVICAIFRAVLWLSFLVLCTETARNESQKMKLSGEGGG